MTNRRAFLACLAALAFILSLLLYQTLFGGMGLTPADGIFRLPPWKGLLPGLAGNYLLSDQYLTLTPLRHFLHEQFQLGRLALWNPNISCGVPSIASMQVAAFFPINLLLSWVDPFRAASLAAFLKLFLAGASMLLFVRQLKASWPAALLSGIAFSLSGFMIVWLGHPHTNSACLLPLLLYFIEWGFNERSARPWAGLALAFGCLALGGHAPTIIHASLMALAYFLFKLWEAPPSSYQPQSFFFGLALLGGLLIAAPQLLPYLEYYRLSSTSAASLATQRWASHLPISATFHLLLPLISGSPAHHFEILGAPLGVVANPYANFNERTGYVGVLALFLALLAVLYRRDRPVKFFLAALIFCLCVIGGLPPLSQIIKVIPLINGINHTRLLLFVCFSLSVLAGLGLDEVERIKRPRLLTASLWLGAGLTLFLLWEIFGPLLRELTASEKSYLLRQLPVFLGGIFVASLVTLASHSPWRQGLCLVWVSFELLWYGFGYNPALPRSLYYPQTKALEFLAQDRSLFRMLGLGWVLPPNTGILYGMQDARGQDFTSLKRYEELITGGSGEFSFYLSADSLPASFAALGVKYLLSAPNWKPPSKEFKRVYDGEIAVYRAPSYQGRALIFSDYKVTTKEQVLSLMRSPDFNLKKTLLLEEDLPAMEKEQSRQEHSKVSLVSYTPDEVILEASTPEAGFLLLLDSYYPGWQATVNGAPAKIYRANYNFRAVRLPAGKSQVRFTYRPFSFRLGAWLAAISLCGLLLIFICDPRRH